MNVLASAPSSDAGCIRKGNENEGNERGRGLNAQGLPVELPHPIYGSLSRMRRQQGRGRLGRLPGYIVASRTTEGMRPRPWTTPLVALDGPLVLSPPRMRRVPGFNTHPIQAGRPSKPSAFHGSNGVASLSAPPRESALACGLHHLVAGRGALRNGVPERPAGPSSTYR